MSYVLFTALLMKSAKIQKEIDVEQGLRRPDWMRLLRLKKIRLKIKDRLLQTSFDARARQPISLRKPALAHVGSVSAARWPRLYPN